MTTVVGHARRNLAGGIGGPQDAGLLHDHVDLAARVTGARRRALRAAKVARETPGGTAIDAVVVAGEPLSDRLIEYGQVYPGILLAPPAPRPMLSHTARIRSGPGFQKRCGTSDSNDRESPGPRS